MDVDCLNLKYSSTHADFRHYMNLAKNYELFQFSSNGQRVYLYHKQKNGNLCGLQIDYDHNDPVASTFRCSTWKFDRYGMDEKQVFYGCCFTQKWRAAEIFKMSAKSLSDIFVSELIVPNIKTEEWPNKLELVEVPGVGAHHRLRAMVIAEAEEYYLKHLNHLRKTDFASGG